MKTFNIAIAILLAVVIFINLFSTLTTDKSFVNAQIQASKLSVGDSYYGRLRLWYLYAQSGDWTNASHLESKLDPGDLAYYQANHQPEKIQQRLNVLTAKTGKTADDWLETAKFQLLLGQKLAVINSLTQARTLDPVRDDISQLYYQINR